MDTIICGGNIIDGTGRAPYKADVLIRREKIEGIGDFSTHVNARRIDASSLTVTPGLIDAHTHADLSLLHNKQQPGAVYQGISTIVIGQCGLGFVPLKPDQLINTIRMNSGIFGHLPKGCPGWEQFSDYMALFENCAVNVGANVSHNAVRQWSCGFENVPLTGKRLEESIEALDQALSEGALGFSVGLSYYPGGYSDTQELIQLCHTVKKHDALFCVHMRLDINHPDFKPMDEIAEVIAATGVRTNLLHHRTGGMEASGSVTAPFQKLIDQGMQVSFEFYPYLVGSGLLLAVIPDWAQEGGADAIIGRLKDQALRPRLMRDLIHRHSFFFPKGATGLIYWTKDPHDDARGRTLDEVAQLHKESVYETIIRLLLDNDLEVGFNGVTYQTPDLARKLYDDQYRLFLSEHYTIGSDSIPTGGKSHCRTSSAFPRIIQQMRSRGVAPETIIHKLSGKPAEIYGLKDRGVIAVGNKADICIMDYENVQDCADEAFTRRKPDGILTLLVNGLPVMQDGTLTGELSGDTVRRMQ